MDREGWLNIFCARLERPFRRGRAGRAGWAQYPDIFKSEPVSLTTANPFERLSHRRRPDSTIRIRRSES